MVSQRQKGAWLALVVLIFVLCVQLWEINRPYGGHFGSYQCVMADMAQNYIREDSSQILRPKLDSLLQMKKALHLNQFPFPSLFVSMIIKGVGGEVEFWGRFQSVVWNLLSILLVGLVGKRLFNNEVGFASAVLFALSPYALIYGQSFMSEPFSLFMLLQGIYFYLKDRDKSQLTLMTFLVGLCFSVAVTGRIHFILGMPIFIFDVLLRHRTKGLLKFFSLGLLTVLLPFLWYGYTYYISVNTPNVMTNIFLQAQERSLIDKKYLLNPEYYKLLLDIFSQRFMTPVVFPFIVAGVVLLIIRVKENFLWIGFVLLNAMLLILSPQKVMDHDFYLYALFPFLALGAGYGFVAFLRAFQIKKKGLLIAGLLLLYTVFSARYFAHPIYKDDLPHQLYKNAVKAIEEHVKVDDPIVVFGNGLAIMAFYADRPYWAMDADSEGKKLPYYLRNPKYRGVRMEEILAEEKTQESFEDWLEALKTQGAKYFIAYSRSDLEEKSRFHHYLREKYQMLSKETDSFYMFKLF
jgi:hypothetical protein